MTELNPQLDFFFLNPGIVFDVESVGVHGRPFIVAWAVVRDGDISEQGYSSFDPSIHGPELDKGELPDTYHDWAWMEKNVFPNLPPPTCDSPLAMRQAFWQVWMQLKEDEDDVWMAAEVPWPIESKFLSQCIADDFPARRWLGPYPLLDIATIRMGLGHPFASEEKRLLNELPLHDPRADVRQSWRLLREDILALYS
jgi:hypothetical protein